MRILVVGKAKTGTTLISHLLASSLSGSRVLMEPKSSLEFYKNVIPFGGDEIFKIIFEHFISKLPELSEIINNDKQENSVDKLVFIKRDVRDEMVSRLMFFSRALPPNELQAPNWRKWISLLEEKERSPADQSFYSLCCKFQELFAINAWENVLMHVREAVVFDEFIEKQVKRDFFTIRYESVVKNDTKDLSDYVGAKIAKRAEEIRLGDLEYTKRTGSFDNWRRYFTDDDVEILRPILTSELNDDCYDDWRLERPGALPAEHYSGYVERMVFGPRA